MSAMARVLCLCAGLGAMPFAAVSGVKQRSRARASTRIINGSAVEHPLSTYSFFALPTSSAGSDQWLGCGASIISPTFALSSAHCFGGGNNPCTGPQSIAVWVGDITMDASTQITGGEKSFRTEAELICHSKYDGKCSHGHDLALLKLKTPVPNWVKPVPLDLGSSEAMDGKPVTSIGFGLMEDPFDRTYIGEPSPGLRAVNLSVLKQDSADCVRVFAGGFGCSDDASEAQASNKDQQICAGATDGPERDTCSGDSGSPMVDANGRQVAIVSYGGGPGASTHGAGRECGDPRFPGVYARVSAFADFLREHVPDLPNAVDTATVHA